MHREEVRCLHQLKGDPGYMRYFGTALIVFTLGIITWQLIEAQDKKQAGAEILVSVGGAFGGGLLGEMGGTLLFGWIMGDLGTVIGGILGGGGWSFCRRYCGRMPF